MNLSIVNDSSHDRSEHESAEVDVNSSPLKEAYSSLLSVMFSNSGCALEVRAARAMFSDRSQVVLIPRQRPVFASAMKFEDFLGFGRTAVNCSDDWVETTRVQESFELEAPARPRLQPRRIQALRTRSTLVLKSRSVESNVRSVDVQFVMNMHAFVQKIDFCAVIYDECPRDRDAYPAGAGG